LCNGSLGCCSLISQVVFLQVITDSLDDNKVYENFADYLKRRGKTIFVTYTVRQLLKTEDKYLGILMMQQQTSFDRRKRNCSRGCGKTCVMLARTKHM
jgi:hypothetical protein